VLAMSLFQACEEDEPMQMDISTISYEKDIEPIIRTACAISSCHVSGFEHGSLESYSEVKIYVDSGDIWFRTLVTRSMPPLNSLFQVDLDKIQLWIEEGALDN